jgi:hypothetical protein
MSGGILNPKMRLNFKPVHRPRKTLARNLSQILRSVSGLVNKKETALRLFFCIGRNSTLCFSTVERYTSAIVKRESTRGGSEMEFEVID